ncbi:MAG: J domain-containing protein [Candidatus Sericytochromatia bacterium]
MVSTTINLDILKETDHYKVLGVNDNTSNDEIQTTYKNLAKLYHPDRADSSKRDIYNQIFTKITSSYNILKDPEKRKNYDYEKKLKEEYEKITAFSQKNFQGANVVEKSTSKPGGFNLSAAISKGTVYNYDDYKSPDKPKAENTIKNNISPNIPPQTNSQAKKGPTDITEKMYNDAMEKYKNGNIDAAILDLQTATVMVKVAKYHSALGLFMKEKGWHGYAQVEFKKALEIDSKDKIATKYLAEYDAKKEELMNKGKEIQNKIEKSNQGFIAKIINAILGLFKSNAS